MFIANNGAHRLRSPHYRLNSSDKINYIKFYV